MIVVAIYRCDRCGVEHRYEELDPHAGRFDLLCVECAAEVKAEAEV